MRGERHNSPELTPAMPALSPVLPVCLDVLILPTTTISTGSFYVLPQPSPDSPTSIACTGISGISPPRISLVAGTDVAVAQRRAHRS